MLPSLWGILPRVGVQHMSPQGVPLLYVDCFELKATKTLWAHEKLMHLFPH